MNVITRKRIVEYAARHPDAAGPLMMWYRVARKAKWRSIRDVRAAFPHADGMDVASGGVVTVFNIGGNKCRLVTAIHYNRQRVYVLLLLTHAEYSKGTWKESL
ncbi:MAG: type II toxin-antitoxin system HigB family toxin [Planctomycetes bacterium]|nr:type II toxin-antitoxin system HigB family toxin [Planctomycetota bacterium]